MERDEVSKLELCEKDLIEIRLSITLDKKQFPVYYSTVKEKSSPDGDAYYLFYYEDLDDFDNPIKKEKSLYLKNVQWIRPLTRDTLGGFEI
jgi:hypothetical protein